MPLVNKAKPKRQRAAPNNGTRIDIPRPVVDAKGVRPVFLGHLAVGDWNGAQPGGFHGNNSFPRKTLVRLVVKELRRRAERGQWKESGVLVVPYSVSEYRTSRQSPCMCHRVTGQKIDRRNAKSDECGAKELQGKQKTSWKLLVCPVCNNILNRDRSAASAIAANHERRELAKRFNCDAPVHAGYARGSDSNVAMPADAG